MRRMQRSCDEECAGKCQGERLSTNGLQCVRSPGLNVVVGVGGGAGLASTVAMTRRWSPAFTAALHAVWLATLAVAIDALVLEPFGVRFLPADRVADGAFLLLLVASGLGAGVVVDAIGRRLPASAVAAAVIAGLVVFSLPGQRLALWPRAVDWPSYAAMTRGLRLDDLWHALRDAPPGRVLFIRSGVPLVHGTEWYRPHTHVTALTPWVTGRDIIGGSPVVDPDQ